MDARTAFVLGGSAATLLTLFGLWLAVRGPNAAARFRGRLMVVAAVVIGFNVWVSSLPLPAPPAPPTTPDPAPVSAPSGH